MQIAKMISSFDWICKEYFVTDPGWHWHGSDKDKLRILSHQSRCPVSRERSYKKKSAFVKVWNF